MLIRNVPNLRFPGFEGSWERRKLGEVAEKIGDGLHGTPNYIEKSDFHFINGNNLINGKIELNENVKKVDQETFLKNDKELSENSLLISINGTIGNIAKYNNEKVMLGKSVGYFNFNENSDFLYYTLQTESVQNFFISELTGSTIKNLSLKTLREALVLLPSEDEQQKIASFLTLIDERIQTQKKIIEELIEQQKSISFKIFNQTLRLKSDSDFSEWKTKKLSSLGKIYNGLTGKTKEDFGEGKPYIQYKQIFDNSKINFKNCGLVNIDDKEKQNEVIFGDVFFTTSSETPNEIATSSVLLENVEETYLNSFCFGFRLNQDVILPQFARFLFRSSSFRKSMIPLAQGSTRYNISKIDFLKVKTSLPSLEEQTKIADFLSAMDAKIEVEKQLLEKLNEQKKYFLQNMFV